MTNKHSKRTNTVNKRIDGRNSQANEFVAALELQNTHDMIYEGSIIILIILPAKIEVYRIILCTIVVLTAIITSMVDKIISL